MTDIHNIIANSISRSGKDRLITLDLGRIEIHDLSTDFLKEIFDFEELEVLKIRNQRLVEIPSEITRLRKLRKLDLSLNRIKFIPKWIGELENLTHLELRQNSLNKLPRSKLTGLLKGGCQIFSVIEFSVSPASGC